MTKKIKLKLSAKELKEKMDIKDGVTPVKGVDYSDGKDGQDGQDGRTGKDGNDGKDGRDGQDGLDGNDGKDGKDGKTLKDIREFKKIQKTDGKILKGMENLQHNIDIISQAQNRMPDFRKLGMGLQEQIDNNKALITAESLWDRTGTTLVPQFPNDNVDLGSGNFDTTGTISDGVLTISDGNITGMGNITGTDVDISAGSGTYTSSGTLSAGAITGTSLTDGTATLSGGNLTDMGNITGTDVDISAGSGTFVTTGKGTFGDLDVDTLNFNGNTISDSTGTVFFNNDILVNGDVGSLGAITAAGTVTGLSFTDGTTTITGGNYTGVGNITGTDVDISAGTGDYSSSGTITTTGNIYIDSDSSILGLGAAGPATPDATIGFDGSDTEIKSNLVGTNGLILQQQSIAISSTGVTPTDAYPLKVIMDATSTRGIYIDGQTNPVTTTMASWALNMDREYAISDGSEIPSLRLGEFLIKDNSTNAVITSGKEHFPLRFFFDRDATAKLTNTSSSSFTNFVYGMFAQIDDDGTYDTSSTGDLTQDVRAFFTHILGAPTLTNTGGESNPNDYDAKGFHSKISKGPTIGSGTWDCRNYGFFSEVTVR